MRDLRLFLPDSRRAADLSSGGPRYPAAPAALPVSNAGPCRVALLHLYKCNPDENCLTSWKQNFRATDMGVRRRGFVDPVAVHAQQMLRQRCSAAAGPGRGHAVTGGGCRRRPSSSPRPLSCRRKRCLVGLTRMNSSRPSPISRYSGGAGKVKNTDLNRMYERNIDFDRDGENLSPRCDLVVPRHRLALTSGESTRRAPALVPLRVHNPNLRRKGTKCLIRPGGRSGSRQCTARAEFDPQCRQ